MIIIYTPYQSPRLKYVLNYIFGHQLGVNWQLTDDENTSIEGAGLKINYSGSSITGFYHILSCGLLDENGIDHKEIEVSEHNGLKVIFKNEGDAGYDIFSAVFYCLSRYEEYENSARDVHGRFKHTDSFLWKNNCLQLPLVDMWVADLKKTLIARYGFVSGDFKSKVFSAVPTIDIDAAFAYNGRGFIRQMAGFAKSAVEFNLPEIIKRFKVTYTGNMDPNDNFDYQFQELNKQQQKAFYFIQIGAYGKFDKNISPSDKSFQKIIRSIIKNGHTVGLHPSYDSDSNPDIIKKEKEILENIINYPVVHTRQHYLRFNLPGTYRILAGLGFQKEFSMGYSEVTGFRAATSLPFYWYDLQSESETNLEIIPFCAMDVAFKQFRKKTVKQTIEESEDLRQTISFAEGQFCFVFHNESLSNHRGWEGWRHVFEAWLKNENKIH